MIRHKPGEHYYRFFLRIFRLPQTRRALKSLFLRIFRLPQTLRHRYFFRGFPTGAEENRSLLHAFQHFNLKKKSRTLKCCNDIEKKTSLRVFNNNPWKKETWMYFNFQTNYKEWISQSNCSDFCRTSVQGYNLIEFFSELLFLTFTNCRVN